MMVYWNQNFITSIFFHIKFFSLDYIIFQYFFRIVGLFSVIYFHNKTLYLKKKVLEFWN